MKYNKQIPKGIYCYDKNGLCPYWDDFEHMEEQNSGYCHLLGRGDWEAEWFGLLWDLVKECGLNKYDEEDCE